MAEASSSRRARSADRPWRRAAFLLPVSIGAWGALLLALGAMLSAPRAKDVRAPLEVSLAGIPGEDGGASGISGAAGVTAALAHAAIGKHIDSRATTALNTRGLGRHRDHRLASAKRSRRHAPISRVARASAPRPLQAKSETVTRNDPGPTLHSSRDVSTRAPAAVRPGPSDASRAKLASAGPSGGRNSASRLARDSDLASAYGPNAGREGQDGAGADAPATLRGVQPVYSPLPVIPENLRDAALDTFVVARFDVDAQGRATVSLVTPTSYGRLNAIVLEALRRWRFRPALRNGRPIAARADLKVEIEVR